MCAVVGTSLVPAPILTRPPRPPAMHTSIKLRRLAFFRLPRCVCVCGWRLRVLAPLLADLSLTQAAHAGLCVVVARGCV